MKKYLFLATAALAALASCSESDFVGDESAREANENGAIVFGTGVYAVTRATKTGGDAATLLNNEFVFAGTKGTSATTFVFDQYKAKYVANTANTTESNSSDWEYVGLTLASPSSLTGTQTIKYWDYAENQYDFAAYSLGAGVDNVYATATAINASTKSYTLTGTADQLKACYVSDLVTAYNHDNVSDYGKPVQFSFRSLASKIRLAFYETVPGYSVKDIKFYTSDDATLATDGTESDPTLYVKTTTDPEFKGLPSGEGTMTITFPTTGWSNKTATDYNKAHIAFAPKTSSDLSTTLVLEDLANYPTTYEGQLTSGNFIGRTSNTATYAGGTTGDPATGKFYTILPYETGANLLLRIKYTLVSTDGSGEEITVDKATAVVPAELAKWNSNYAYTYIFKISDMTNGSTGTDGSGNIITGLTPITLNAVVVDSEDGVQETITTVSNPSITTYTEGKVVTANDEYKNGNVIYIIVNNGTSNQTLTVGTNANLYTVTVDAGAAQGITEESVANALAHGVYDNTAKTYTVTDANGKNLVVTESSLLSASTKIEAADSPTGNEITVAGANFTAAASSTTYYVFEYVKTARSAGVYAAVATGTTLTSGTKYFTSATGAGGFISDGTQIADASHSYWTETTAPSEGEYFYKIIKVIP